MVPKLPPEWISDGETSSQGGRSQKSCLIPAARDIAGTEAAQSSPEEDHVVDSRLQQRAASMDIRDRAILRQQLTQRKGKANCGACSLDGARQECGWSEGSLPELHSPHSSLSQRSTCPHRGASCSASTVSGTSPAADAALDGSGGDPDHACSLSAPSSLMKHAVSNPLCSRSVTSTGSSAALPQRQLYWPQAQYGGAAAASLPSTVGSSIPEDNASEASLTTLYGNALNTCQPTLSELSKLLCSQVHNWRWNMP